VGSIAAVFGFCFVLTLYEQGSIGDDPGFVTAAFFCTLLGTISLLIASKLLNIGMTLRSTCLEKEPTDSIAVI
jgi:hypothetical protein